MMMTLNEPETVALLEALSLVDDPVLYRRAITGIAVQIATDAGLSVKDDDDGADKQ